VFHGKKRALWEIFHLTKERLGEGGGQPKKKDKEKGQKTRATKCNKNKMNFT